MFINRVIQLLDIGAIIGGSVYRARTAAIDVAHVVEDYVCRDYTCFTLDCIPAGFDIAATIVAFFPKTNVTSIVFAGSTAASKFLCTLRNKCKSVKGGLFGGCKN